MATYGLQQVFEESVSAVTATPSIAIGTERWVNGKKYVYVYNGSTSTASVKYGVVYSANSGYTVTVSSIVAESLAGVVVHTDIPTINYGWVCTKGHVALTSSGLSAIVVGDKVILGALGTFTRSTGGTGWSGYAQGTATGATTTAGTFSAFINLG
jgi:hypothetical protein